MSLLSTSSPQAPSPWLAQQDQPQSRRHKIFVHRPTGPGALVIPSSPQGPQGELSPSLDASFASSMSLSFDESDKKDNVESVFGSKPIPRPKHHRSSSSVINRKSSFTRAATTGPSLFNRASMSCLRQTASGASIASKPDAVFSPGNASPVFSPSHSSTFRPPAPESSLYKKSSKEQVIFRQSSKDKGLYRPGSKELFRQPSKEQVLFRQSSKDQLFHQSSKDQLFRQTSKDTLFRKPSQEQVYGQSTSEQVFGAAEESLRISEDSEEGDPSCPSYRQMHSDQMMRPASHEHMRGHAPSLSGQGSLFAPGSKPPHIYHHYSYNGSGTPASPTSQQARSLRSASFESSQPPALGLPTRTGSLHRRTRSSSSSASAAAFGLQAPFTYEARRPSVIDEYESDHDAGTSSDPETSFNYVPAAVFRAPAARSGASAAAFGESMHRRNHSVAVCSQHTPARARGDVMDVSPAASAQSHSSIVMMDVDSPLPPTLLPPVTLEHTSPPDSGASDRIATFFTDALSPLPQGRRGFLGAELGAPPTHPGSPGSPTPQFASSHVYAKRPFERASTSTGIASSFLGPHRKSYSVSTSENAKLGNVTNLAGKHSIASAFGFSKDFGKFVSGGIARQDAKEKENALSDKASRRYAPCGTLRTKASMKSMRRAATVVDASAPVDKCDSTTTKLAQLTVTLPSSPFRSPSRSFAAKAKGVFSKASTFIAGENLDRSPFAVPPAMPVRRLMPEGSPVVGFRSEEARGKTLPCFGVKEDGLMRITPGTLNDLQDGKFGSAVKEFILIDCRFKYEYDGGHIQGAINLATTDQVDEYLLKRRKNLPEPSTSEHTPEGGKTILVFHCEFSVKRAPTSAKFLRSRDRAMNVGHYPNIHYPELYVLQGGYSDFYRNHPGRCTGAYLRMDDPQHLETKEADMHAFRKRNFHRATTYS